MSRLKRITRLPIDTARILKSVKDDSAGGTVLFVGTVRNRSQGRAVYGLDYDVYKEMAEERMDEIEDRIRRSWRVKKIAMVHRYGALKVGEVSVAVAVSSEHRAEAFRACRYAIDTIKGSLPLWKKEKLEVGTERWARGRPIRG